MIAGRRYADAIVRAIDGAKVLVLVLSHNSASSDHVLREVERASSKRHPVISLRIDLAPLPSGLEYFLNTSQWLDASSQAPGHALPKLVEAVCRVIASERAAEPWIAAGVPGKSVTPGGARPATARRSRLTLGVAAVALLAIAGFGVRYLLAGHGARDDVGVSPTSTTPASAAPAIPLPAAFTPPPHSVAVLPFVNMSGDPKQDYFSDGLSEELLNSLTSVRDLLVAARTSSFYFKGKEVDVSEIAHKLNVGALLEGSVRKDGQHVRISAQLINAVTGFHLWSQTYDRDLDKNAWLNAAAAFGEATRLDPAFARAWALKARAELGFAEYYGVGPEVRDYFNRARADAEHAVMLAPKLAQAHLALAMTFDSGFLDFPRAWNEYQRALALSPNDAEILITAADFRSNMGHHDDALTMARRAVSLDQINPRSFRLLADILGNAHMSREAIDAANHAIELQPNIALFHAVRGFAQLIGGDSEAAVQSCETPMLDWSNRLCLAIGYARVHRHADAEAQVAAMKAEFGDGTAYQFAEIYTQWGQTDQALTWLEAALRLRDAGLSQIWGDAFLDPLRNQPRYQAVAAALKAPE